LDLLLLILNADCIVLDMLLK